MPAPDESWIEKSPPPLNAQTKRFPGIVEPLPGNALFELSALDPGTPYVPQAGENNPDRYAD